MSKSGLDRILADCDQATLRGLLSAVRATPHERDLAERIEAEINSTAEAVYRVTFQTVMKGDQGATASKFVVARGADRARLFMERQSCVVTAVETVFDGSRSSRYVTRLLGE